MPAEVAHHSAEGATVGRCGGVSEPRLAGQQVRGRGVQPDAGTGPAR
jgi:hypothetical protein